MIYLSPTNISLNKTLSPSFKANKPAINISKTLEKDIFEKNINNLKRKLLEIRNSYIENNDVEDGNIGTADAHIGVIGHRDKQHTHQ